jgi:hypothetical protein
MKFFINILKKVKRLLVVIFTNGEKMRNSIERKLQLNDQCPNCIKYNLEKIGKLQYMYEHHPYTNEYLLCVNCNSKYSLNHKVLWQEEINTLAVDMHDVLENKLTEIGMILDVKDSDIIYDKLVDMIEQYGTGDYRNYN